MADECVLPEDDEEDPNDLDFSVLEMPETESEGETEFPETQSSQKTQPDMEMTIGSFNPKFNSTMINTPLKTKEEISKNLFIKPNKIIAVDNETKIHEGVF